MIRLRFFEAWEKFSFSVIGPAYRFLGKSMAQTGLSLQGESTSDDRLVPSLRRKPYKDIRPQIRNAKFIAPNAVIIGDVELGEDSSIWYGSVVRGDRKKIKVGQNTVIQDLVSFVPTEDSQGIEIGDNVTIGPNALIQSGKVENYSFIGMGSTLRKGSKVESYGVVAAGAVVTENTVVPSYQIWAGNPAKYLRDLTNEEKQTLDEHHSELLDLARIHAEESEKSFREILNDKDRQALYDSLTLEDTLALKMRELGLPVDAQDEENMEQRVFYKEYEPTESEIWKKNYDIYEQDLFNFPDNFKIKGENYERYEKLKKHFEDNPEEDVRLTEKFQTIPQKSNEAFTRKF